MKRKRGHRDGGKPSETATAVTTSPQVRREPDLGGPGPLRGFHVSYIVTVREGEFGPLALAVTKLWKKKLEQLGHGQA
jgi:hypothetical protein